MALPFRVRASLPDLCRLWGVRDVERWPDHAGLSGFLVDTAVLALRDRHERAGLSRTAALRSACEALDLPPATYRRRLARWRKDYLESGDEMSPNPRAREVA